MIEQTLIRFTAGAYVTNTVRGKRASCTASAQQAAERLGRKLFGELFVGAAEIGKSGTGATIWLLHSCEV